MTLESPLIRVGLLGHGSAGRRLHGPLIEAAGAFRIVAVSTSRAETLAERRDAPRQEMDPRAVIQADDVDLVVVATPNDTHADLAAAALEAGKAVVVDKPLALSTADADRLIALAKAKGRMLTVFQNRRWDGDFLAVRQAIGSGELGEILLVEARWDRFRPVAARTWKNAPGGGVLWDLGSHLIDQALQMFGAPEAVAADLAIQRDGALTDDYAELTLTYGRMRCILSAACVVAAARPRFAVHGTKGSLLTFGVDPGEGRLQGGRHPSDPDFSEGLSIPAERVTAEGREALHLPAGDWVAFYRAVAASLRTGAPPPVDPAEVRAALAIIERAYAEAGM